MLAHNRFALFSLIVTLLLLVSLAAPIAALADEGTPPPEPTAETDTPSETEDAPPTDETPTADPSAASSPTEPAPTEPADATLPEALEQAPEGTDVVVLDENGEVQTLATEEAEDILLGSDPMWCPEGETPGPANADVNCSPSFESFTELIIWLIDNDPDADGTIWIEAGYDSSINDPGDDFLLDGDDFTDLDTHALMIQGGWSGGNDTTIDSAEPSTLNGTLSILYWQGDVTLNDLLVDGADGTGIEVVTSGDIELTRVASTNNDGIGADLQGSSIHIQDSDFSDNADVGLAAADASPATITLSNVTVNGNGLGGAYLFSEGTVIVENSEFSNNGADIDFDCEEVQCECEVVCFLEFPPGFGLFVLAGIPGESDGSTSITLDQVTADNNAVGGAFLIAPDSISVSNSQFSGNGGYAEPCEFDESLESLFFCSIIVQGTGLVATDGALLFSFFDCYDEIEECLSEGEGGSQITLNNVVANENAFGGAHLVAQHISVSNSQFWNNGFGAEPCSGEEFDAFLCLLSSPGFGLTAQNFSLITLFFCAFEGGGEACLPEEAGQISLSHVLANENAFGGSFLIPVGDLSVEYSDFSRNGSGTDPCDEPELFDLCLLLGSGFSSFTFEGDSTVTVVCSSANDNAAVGFMIASEEIVLNSVTAVGNGYSDFELDAGNVVTLSGPCDTGGDGPGTPPPPTIIPVTGGEQVTCEGVSSGSVSIVLPNGDHVVLPCPINDFAILNTLLQDGLLGELGGNYTFRSAMDVGVIRDEQPLEVIDGAMTVSFVIPEGVDPESLAILWWNGSEWVELGSVEAEGLQVFSSGHATDDGYFQALVNFTGTFVLVSK